MTLKVLSRPLNWLLPRDNVTFISGNFFSTEAKVSYLNVCMCYYVCAFLNNSSTEDSPTQFTSKHRWWMSYLFKFPDVLTCTVYICTYCTGTPLVHFIITVVGAQFNFL